MHVIGICLLFELSACIPTMSQRVMYESKGQQIGVESDHSIDERASPPVLNRHPPDVTVEELRTLLGSLEVSGWSGIILGVFETPQPKPVFSGIDLINLSDVFAKAFHEATPRDRVFFSFRNPQARYETDRTAGSLFFRDDYLHVILTDHYAFQKADPGGGEQRDPRDTKGMHLWIVRPAQSAVVPEDKEPRWGPFEKVHISLKIRDVLAALGTRHPSSTQTSASRSSTSTVNLEPQNPTPAPMPDKNEDLRQQFQELGSANQNLRSRIEDQTAEIDKLKEELRRLSDDMKASKPSKSPSERKSPRKQSAQ